MSNDLGKFTQAIHDVLGDYGDGYTNIVDVVQQLASSADKIAHAITPIDAAPGRCPSGEGQVGSLTEAVMGLTRSMTQIAEAINAVAQVLESR